MHDDLDRRIHAAIRAEGDSAPLAVTEDMVARRLQRSSAPPGVWIGLVAALAVVVTAAALGPIELETVFSGQGNSGPVPLDSSWQLISGDVDGALIPISGDYRITVAISADSIGGSTGCNTYGAAMSWSGHSVAIGDVVMTQAGCARAPGKAERAYLAAFRRVTAMQLDGGELLMSGPGVTLRFDALRDLDRHLLAGTSWILESLVEAGKPRSPGASANLVLRDDGTFAAWTGCRDLTGTWMVSGDRLVTPALDASGECSDELVDQDGHFLSVLGNGPARIEGDRLTLSTDGSLGLVFVPAQ